MQLREDQERAILLKKAQAKHRLEILEGRQLYEADLMDFVRGAWSAIDSSEFMDSWALEALCEHLMAVTRGEVRRLLINFPPRCGKSNVASVCWPAWVWAQSERRFLSGPSVRFLCGSYGHSLSLQHSNLTRRLLGSPFYQRYWGDRFSLTADQNTKNQFDNTEGGRRIATSVDGSLIGIGGDVCMIDDPHNTAAVESEAERETVLRWWREISSTRLNSPKESAVVVIMQRLHREDVSGVIIDSMADGNSDWTHLMLPMRHDVKRHCITHFGGITWEDPRSEEGELLWPERYGDQEVRQMESQLGPYLASGRLQQSPNPAGGNIFKEDWWKMYDLDAKGKPLLPPHFMVASLDPAYTNKQENDPSGFTIWGVFKDKDGYSKVALIYAWQKRLELHGVEVERERGETEASYISRSKPHWGLVEWVANDCKRMQVDKLLIEAKASGLSVAQEIKRLYRGMKWGVETVDPGGLDKRARAYSVQHLFADGLVHAPDRDWADMVISEFAKFRGLPGDEDNLVDAGTQALRWLRDSPGALLRRDEAAQDERDKARYQRPLEPLYEV